MSNSASVWAPAIQTEISGNTKSVSEVIVATEGQVAFNLTTFEYARNTGALEIYKQGLLVTPLLAWEEVSSTMFTLTTPASSGDIIVAVGKVGITGAVNTCNFSEVSAAASAVASEASAVNSEASAVTSEAASVVSLSAANYIGEWSTLSGAAFIYASVSHNDSFYMLLVSLADVTSSEPGVTADWQAIQSITDNVALGLNVAKNAVQIGIAGTTISATCQYLYVPNQQKTYGKPAAVGDGETITSIVNAVLETNIANYLMELVISTSEFINTLASNSGSDYVGTDNGETVTERFASESVASSSYADAEVNALRFESRSGSLLDSNSVPSAKLSVATDGERIQLSNLSDAVLAAIAGTAPVDPVIGDGQVTRAKIANGAVNFEKIDDDFSAGAAIVSVSLNTIRDWGTYTLTTVTDGPSYIPLNDSPKFLEVKSFDAAGFFGEQTLTTNTRNISYRRYWSSNGSTFTPWKLVASDKMYSLDPSIVDVNNIIYSDVYYVANTASISNMPASVTGAGMLSVSINEGTTTAFYSLQMFGSNDVYHAYRLGSTITWDSPLESTDRTLVDGDDVADLASGIYFYSSSTSGTVANLPPGINGVDSAFLAVSKGAVFGTTYTCINWGKTKYFAGVIRSIDAVVTWSVSSFSAPTDRKLMLLGDSLMAGTISSLWESTNIKEFSEVTNEAVGGASWALRTPPNAPVDAISVVSLTSAGSALDIENTDAFCVWVGTNDWGNSIPLGSVSLANTDTQTVVGAINVSIANIISRRPSAYIVIATPLYRASALTPNSDGVDLYQFSNAIIDIASQHSIPVVDMLRSGGVNALNIGSFTTDGLHPTLLNSKSITTGRIAKFNSLNSY